MKKAYSLQQQIENFWRFVKKGKVDECWIYTGTKSGIGYGHHRFFGKQQGAHRISFKICRGEIPPGIFVCHVCDNPPCVNPNHLFLGTRKDNQQDRRNKGGYSVCVKGEAHYCSKLTDETCFKLKTLLPSMTDLQLSRQFGISRTAVWFIRNGLTWKHIHNPNKSTKQATDSVRFRVEASKFFK